MVDALVASHTELRDAARAFGRDGNFASLGLRCDGLDVTVGLDIDSGIVRGVDYSLGSAGLPDVTFRREDDHDQLAKERGIARELQTGDEEFDRAVYIESDAPDAHLQTTLASPAVRAAIVKLTNRGLSVRILDGTVKTNDRDRPDCFAEVRVRDIASALRVIAGAPRSLERAAPEPRSGARVAANFVYVFLPLGIGLLWLGSSTYPAVAYGNLVFSGVLGAVMVAAAIQPLLTRAVRGRSTSHRELVPLRASSFVGFSVFGIGLAIFLNGALDKSAEWTEAGTVQSASHDNEDGNTSVTIRTPARSLEITVSDSKNEVRAGHAATLWLRAGAFGQPWQSRAVVVK